MPADASLGPQSQQIAREPFAREIAGAAFSTDASGGRERDLELVLAVA
jgi:hypothetical protein